MTITDDVNIAATPETDPTPEAITTSAISSPPNAKKRKHHPETISRCESGNYEGMINDDITLFEAWFELMATSEKEKVNVEELVNKVSTSGLFTFNNNTTNLSQKTEEKTVKEELLDLIEEDLSLHVVGRISMDQFFAVMVRYPRYLHRLQRAAGEVTTPPKVWTKPAPRTRTPPRDVEDDLADGLDPFESPRPPKKKKDRRGVWRRGFRDMFESNSAKLPFPHKRRKNPKRLCKQSSSFYERCRSVSMAFMGKKSTMKVFVKEATKPASLTD